jgi:MFS family permease
MASAASAPPTPPAQPANLPRVVAASLIGTTIEWYDFFLYGSAAALVFNKLFFPDSDPLVGTLLSFLTYAVGFVARPLGALVFGHYGDRLGRKKLLVLSLLMMGGGDLRDRIAAHARDVGHRGSRTAHGVASGPGLRAGR